MSGPFQLPPAGAGGGGSGAPKRKRQSFGPVPKCGECTTCLRPTLKKSCLRNRPQSAAGGGGGYSAAAARPQPPPQPSILESLPLPDQEKPAVPRGVAGFRLPIAPQQRPSKWSRQWCALRRIARAHPAGALTPARARRVPQEPLEAGDPPCWVLRWMPGASLRR